MSERRDQIKRRVGADRDAVCRALGMQRDEASKRWWCPFCQSDGGQHDDGDFSTARGFKCHKCDWKGDAFKLVMAARNCDFPAALDFLGEVYGVPRSEPERAMSKSTGCRGRADARRRACDVRLGGIARDLT